MRNRQSGVSQLEMLMALAVMGLIAIGVASAINFGRQVLDRSFLVSNAAEQALSRQILRKWAEEMPLRFGNETAAEFFELREGSFWFRSLPLESDFWLGEPTRVALVLSEENGPLVIEGNGLTWETKSARTETRILGRQVTDLHITVYGRKSEDADPKWHEDWNDPTFLPDLVRITWVEDGQIAPPLTLIPAKTARQRYMSLSSLVPPD